MARRLLRARRLRPRALALPRDRAPPRRNARARVAPRAHGVPGADPALCERPGRGAGVSSAAAAWWRITTPPARSSRPSSAPRATACSGRATARRPSACWRDTRSTSCSRITAWRRWTAPPLLRALRRLRGPLPFVLYSAGADARTVFEAGRRGSGRLPRVPVPHPRAAAPGSRRDPRRGPGALRACAAGRRAPGRAPRRDPGRPRLDPARRALLGLGADPGGDGDGKGARGPGHPRGERARALRVGLAARALGRRARERALRPPARRLHRRGSASTRASSKRRAAAPCSSTRSATPPLGAGEAAARPRDPRGEARRGRRRAARRRPGGGGDAPGSRSAGEARRLPRGPLVPDPRRGDPPAVPRRAQRWTFRRSAPRCSPTWRGRRAWRRPPSEAAPSSCSRASPGAATCASSAACSRTPCSGGAEPDPSAGAEILEAVASLNPSLGAEDQLLAERMLDAWRRHGWNQEAARRELGLTRAAWRSRLARLGLDGRRRRWR